MDRGMMRSAMLLVGTLAGAVTWAHADFSYQETVQVTGGTIVGMMKMVGVFSKQARQANEPIVSTVSIRGNRMVRADKLHTEIIDLDAGTVTTIDHTKRQYTTMTFEQMRQQMDAAIAKAKAEQAKQAPQQQQAETAPPNVDMSFDVKVRNTGATKDVAGLNTKESILAMTMNAKDRQSGQTGAFAMTNDMYLAEEVPGYDEVREFYKKYAVKMGEVTSGALTPQMMALMRQPGAGKGMADMVEEMSKLKGIPVLQIMRMGTTLNGTPLPAASEAPLPSGPPPPSASDVAKSAVMNSLPFGGFAKKKRQEEPSPVSDSAAAQAASAVLVEMTSQMTNFSRGAVDASAFAVPAGYARVDPRQVE